MRLNTSVREALQWGTARLKKASVDSPALDAELLLVHVIKALHLSSIEDKCNGCVAGRSWLYAHPEYVLECKEESKFQDFVRRRIRREPVAYILSHKEFYGLDFLVNQSVLIPRPETEMLVEQAIREVVRGQVSGIRCQIVDVGTGSGAIAVAIARELKIKNVKCKIFTTDISPQALRIAKQNARRNGVEKQIRFLKGNLLEPIQNVKFKMQNVKLIVVANLPYLPTAEWRAAMPEVRKYEPRQALDGGKDGLKYYREMFGQIECKMQNVKCKISVLCEICPEQAEALKKLVRDFFPRAKFEVIKDLAGRNRVVVVKI